MVSATVARERTKPVLCLTIDYGQRAARMEILHSLRVCRSLKLRHRVVRLPFFADFKGHALLGRAGIAPQKDLRRLKDLWVPNRNALFINVAACYAEHFKADLIVTGFNREEADEFPDNTRSFVCAVNRSLEYSTLRRVKVKSFVQDLDKRSIYRLGSRIGAPLQHVYSCYLGGERMCGRCASCRRLLDARR